MCASASLHSTGAPTRGSFFSENSSAQRALWYVTGMLLRAPGPGGVSRQTHKNRALSVILNSLAASWTDPVNHLSSWNFRNDKLTQVRMAKPRANPHKQLPCKQVSAFPVRRLNREPRCTWGAGLPFVSRKASPAVFQVLRFQPPEAGWHESTHPNGVKAVPQPTSRIADGSPALIMSVPAGATQREPRKSRVSTYVKAIKPKSSHPTWGCACSGSA